MNTPVAARPKRVAFFGSGAFGLPSLREIHRHHHLECIVTQPDRPAGRGGRLTPTPVAEWAAEHAPGVALLKPEDVNRDEVVARIREAGPDAWVVIAFGQKLGEPLLRDRAAMNLHASLLPRWRGAAPIQSAILAGDDVTGNSVITLAARMDAGLVLARSRREIEPDQTAGDLHDALAGDGAPLLLEVLARPDPLSAGEPQDEAAVTRAGKLSRADAWVRFEDGAEACRRRINGLSPWPGVQAALGDLQLKLVRAVVADATHPQGAAPGTLTDPEKGLIACGGATSLELLEVQPAGKKAMAWTDFARGRRPESGALLQSGGPPS